MSSTYLISLENVRVTLGGVAVLSDISWTLRPGELWTVAGANGAGKSTFLKLLKGDIWPDPVDGGRRRYHFDEKPSEVPAGLKERMAWVSPEQQERYWTLEWELLAGNVIESGFFQTDYVGRRLNQAQRLEARRLAETLGIAPLWRRNVQTLSQGELRRVLIARALVSRPKLLLLDEATHGLDDASRRGLLQVFEEVARKGTTVVLTTHRVNEGVRGGARCLYLEKGRIVKDRADGNGLGNVPDGSVEPVFSPEKGSKGPLPPDRIPKPANSRLKAVSKKVASSIDDSEPPLVALRDVNVYLGRKRVLRDIHWTIRRGEQWAVVGANGSGKSTLIKALVGDLHPAWGGGITRFPAETLSTLWEVRARVGYLAADFQAAYASERTARDVVASGFFSSVGLMQRPSRAQLKEVQRVLAEFDLTSLADRIFDSLSYGQRRRLLLARAVVHSPQLLALDEPFDGLDAAAREEWIATLDRLARGGTTLVLVTHHEEDVPGWLTHLLRMRDGRGESVISDQ